MARDGFALLVVVLVVTLLAIVALGIASYITESLRFAAASTYNEQALYAAQAGVMRAIVDYRDGNRWDAARSVSAGGEFYYHVGEDANFLAVDSSASQMFRNPDRTYSLRNVPIRNIHASNSITITNMTVTWSSNARLTRVVLGGATVWTGNASSPAALDINDFIIGPGRVYGNLTDQQWVFSRSVSGTVVATFVSSDMSSYKKAIRGAPANSSFSIKATGEIRNGSVVAARRSVVATYNTGTQRITSWEESTRHIMP